jgi:hypothetical protein
MITIEQMVQREVLCCMSSLVSTLAMANGCFQTEGRIGAEELAEQASELAAPVLDYEEAATEAGWEYVQTVDNHDQPITAWMRGADGVDADNEDGPPQFDTAQEACEFDGLDPYESEVFEHWAVSAWFAEKLAEQGERVDTDFAGLCVWARTTTGQTISADSVIEKIYRDMVAPDMWVFKAHGARPTKPHDGKKAWHAFYTAADDTEQLVCSGAGPIIYASFAAAVEQAARAQKEVCKR